MTRKAAAHLPQTPEGEQIFLDHVGWFVADMEAAGAAFERLGFRLTPFVAQHNADPDGGPPKPAGTGNRCAMLQRGYLEILTAVDGVDTPLSQQLNGAVARYNGLHLVAFTVDDAEGAHRQLEEGGFSPQDPVHLRRPITLSDGNEGEVSFTVLRVPPDAMEEGRVQMLRQETPDLVWQDDLIARDNAISALTGIIVCVENPAEAAERYSSFTGRAAVGGGDYFTIDLDRGRIGIAGAEKCRQMMPEIEIPTLPFMAAVVLESRNPMDTYTYFAQNGVRCVSGTERTLRVDPAEAQGASIVVVAEGEIWPPVAG